MESFRRLTGTVPADSISQLVNVLRPNWVAFAVNRNMFRFFRKDKFFFQRFPRAFVDIITCDGIEVTRRLNT